MSQLEQIEYLKECASKIAASTEELLIAIVCRLYNIEEEELYEKKYDRQIAEARKMIMFGMSRLLGYPQKKIGSIFNFKQNYVSKCMSEINHSIKYRICTQDKWRVVKTTFTEHNAN